MSALYLLVLFASWIFVTWLIYRIWNLALFRPLDGSRGPVHTAIGVLIFAGWFGWSFWEVGGKKLYWDYQVRQMCEVDGGVEIYEKVALEPELYEAYAKRGWLLPSTDDAGPLSEYYYRRNTRTYREGDPTVSRWVTEIIRRRDGKVLARYVHYARGGGGMGPGFPSHFGCPDPKTVQFTTAVFNKNKE